MESKKLKPCPFCGGQAKFIKKGIGSVKSRVHFSFGIECIDCGGRVPKSYVLSLTLDEDGEIVPITDERSAAIERWNSRSKEG